METIVKTKLSKRTTIENQQTLLRLIYSALYLLSYLTVRGIINFIQLYTISPYHHKP
jgi:hypothetical protein